MQNCRLTAPSFEQSALDIATSDIEVKPLTPAERRALRARAHALHPVVMMGSAGLTDAVLKEIDLALKNHELIKIRILGDDRDSRENALQRICNALDAGPVQMIGKILVVFRPRPEEPEAPPAARKPSVSPVRRGGVARAKAKRTRGRAPQRGR